ncbi:hypothetical protein [Nonlabens ponticola]|uniref:Uncharacterized protein n=1 Tax=Nonlabens ponticola TaxID=2496866 RepID=A0A3S9MVX0_9FLAO|nr:hypothetical protein [Nonlabens ponticola]AZQ43330.1 hypothetical protein EJ995_03410 [Nonlabens ponticola]
MNSTPQFYQESNSTENTNLIIAIALNTIIAFVLGYLYSMVTTVNPFIYLNFLAALGSGMIIHRLTMEVFKILKIRSKILRVAFVAATGFIVWVLQWLGTMQYLFNDSFLTPADYLISFEWLVDTESFFANIELLFTDGYYELFGIKVDGPVLLIIWLLELIILIGYPVLIMMKQVVKPYSDKFNHWYPTLRLEKQFRVVTGAQNFVHELYSNPVEKIKDLSAGRGNSYSIVEIHYEAREDFQYLSMLNITYDKEKNSQECEVVINNLKISNEAAKQLLDTYDHEKV